jgi:hypothetical protein
MGAVNTDTFARTYNIFLEIYIYVYECQKITKNIVKIRFFKYNKKKFKNVIFHLILLKL